MATTVNYQIGASGDDAHAGGIPNDVGRAIVSPYAALVTTGGVENGNDLTRVWLMPGSHGSNSECSAAMRFTAVAVPQGATIDSATLTLYGEGYNAGSNVIKYSVSAEASDNAPALAADGSAGATLAVSGYSSPPGNRPRTTAVSDPWTQTNVSAAPSESSCTITSVIQEIVSRSGWTSGNAILIIVDTHADTTQAEWQNYYSYDGSTTYAPKLSITYSTGAGALTPNVTPTDGPTISETGTRAAMGLNATPTADTITWSQTEPTPLRVEAGQYAYPISDVARGNWTDQAAGTTNIYQSIDEPTSANDTDYIRSGTAPSSDTYVAGLTALATPDAGTVTLRVRARWAS